MKLKTRILLGCSTLVLALSLSACSGSSAPKNSPTPEPSNPLSSPVVALPSTDFPPPGVDANMTCTIKLGLYPDKNKVEDCRVHDEQYFPRMKELFPNVTIKPNHYDYNPQSWSGLAATKNAPTIFQPWFSEPQSLISRGLVGEVDEAVRLTGFDDYIKPAYVEMLSDKDGKLYGVPRDTYSVGVYVNQQVYRNVAKKYPEIMNGNVPVYPKTFDELYEMCKKMTDATGKPSFGFPGADNHGGWFFSNIAWNFGADLEVEENGKWVAKLNAPEVVKALEFVHKMSMENLLTADANSSNQSKCMQLLGASRDDDDSPKVAFTFGANDFVDVPTKGQLPAKDFAIAPMPAGPDGHQFTLAGGTAYMFAPKTTKEEALASLYYLSVMGKVPLVTESTLAGLRDDANRRQADGIPVIPPISAWVNDDYDALVNQANTEFSNVDLSLYQDYFDLAAKSSRAEPPQVPQIVYAYLNDAVLLAINNKTDGFDAQKILDTRNTSLQEVLDEEVNK